MLRFLISCALGNLDKLLNMIVTFVLSKIAGQIVYSASIFLELTIFLLPLKNLLRDLAAFDFLSHIS